MSQQREAELDEFNRAWEIDKIETTNLVLSCPHLDWIEESKLITREIQESVLEITPILLGCPARIRRERGIQIRRHYNKLILMELRRQLIMELIGEDPVDTF